MTPYQFDKMLQGRIVCHQDIINIIKKYPEVTSDILAAKLIMGIRLQDVLLDMVKDLVGND